MLEAAGEEVRLHRRTKWLDFANCDYWLKHGQMMPEDWKAQIGAVDAIFFGAVGMPDIVPDHVSLWGSLIQFRANMINTSICALRG